MAKTLVREDTRIGRQAVKGGRVCGSQKCCLMESAHINTVCIRKQEGLSASRRCSQPLPLTMWDRSEQAWRCGAGEGMARRGRVGGRAWEKKRLFCSSLWLSSPVVVFKGDLMDAFFGLGRSKQADETQQEGERARRRTWGGSVRAAADHPCAGSDQGR